MNELININLNENENPTVSGRELHEALEVKTRYNDWFTRMCEYGFTEGMDFYSKLSKTSEIGGRPTIDHQLTIPMAKELCMLQRTSKGKMFRQYFISIEEKWNSPEAVFARALIVAKKTNETLTAENKALKDELSTYRKIELSEEDIQNIIEAGHSNYTDGCVALRKFRKCFVVAGLYEPVKTNHLYDFLVTNGFGSYKKDDKSKGVKGFVPKEEYINDLFAIRNYWATAYKRTTSLAITPKGVKIIGEKMLHNGFLLNAIDH